MVAVPKRIDTRATPPQMVRAINTLVQHLSDPIAGQTLLPAGTLGAPPLAFIADTDTGIYRATTDTGALVAGGSIVAEWANSATHLQFLLDDGAVGTPSLSFMADPDTGLYRVSANRFAATAGGIKVAEFANPSGTLFGVGIGVQPSYAFHVNALRTGDWVAAVQQTGSASGDKGFFVSTADTHAATPVFQTVFNATTVGLTSWGDGGVSIGNLGASQGAGTLQLTSTLYLNGTTTYPHRRYDPTQLANNGTMQLHPTVAGAGGYFSIHDDRGYVARYACDGGGTPRLDDGDPTQWTVTSGTATHTNVYYTGGTLTLENKTGAARTYNVAIWSSA